MWSDPLAFFNFRTKVATREGVVRFAVAESATATPQARRA